MSLTSAPYRRRLSLSHRRGLSAVLGASVLLAQLTLPSLDSTRWVGVWPLLLLPVTAVCLHGLTSDAWVWNRLFRRSAQLDEYEIHARNASVVRAYQMGRGWPLWLSFAALLIGGGLLERFPALNVFAGASREVAVGLFVVILWASLDYLPRIMAALGEDEAE